MQPIARQQRDFSQPDLFYYFLDTLVETFNPSETLWAFSVRHFDSSLYQYVDGSLYQHPRQALKAAKLHILINFCERSRELNCLTDYSTDCVLVQSERAIALFGNAQNACAKDFYPNPQDRVEVLRELQLNRSAEQKSHLTNLDGQQLTGVTLFELIELDSDSSFLLELFKPDDVRDCD